MGSLIFEGLAGGRAKAEAAAAAMAVNLTSGGRGATVNWPPCWDERECRERECRAKVNTIYALSMDQAVIL